MKAKILSFLLKLLLVALVCLYFASHPGTISLDWQGWHISTSVSVFLLSLLSILYTLWFLRWIKRKIWDLLKISDRARYKSMKIGVEYLEKALIETYLQNPKKTGDHLKKAQGFLKKTSFPKLLAHYLEKKPGAPDLQSLKKYGVLKAFFTLQKFQEEKDWDNLERFFQTPAQPLLKEGWFWRACFLYQKEMSNWEEAKKALKNAEEYDCFSKQDAFLEWAHIFYHQALEEKDPVKKLGLFERAFAADPKNKANVLAYGQLLKAENNSRLAKKVLTKAWSLWPDWDIAQTYATLFAKDRTPLSHCHMMRELYDVMPQDTTSQICFAISLIRAKLWGQAEALIASIQDPSAKSLLTLILEAKEKNQDDTIPFKTFINFVKTLDALKVNIHAFE